MRHQTRPPSRATLSTSDMQVVFGNVHFVHNTPTVGTIICDNRKDGITQPRMHQFKNLCAHLQEEFLTIPKHPRLAQLDESCAKLLYSKEDEFSERFV